MIEKTHRGAKIALCRRCGGRGYLSNGDGSHEKCPQCEGSGRVTVSGDMIMDVRPYRSTETKD
jgi:DnaJ-class molecular chaperone